MTMTISPDTASQLDLVALQQLADLQEARAHGGLVLAQAGALQPDGAEEEERDPQQDDHADG